MTGESTGGLPSPEPPGRTQSRDAGAVDYYSYCGRCEGFAPVQHTRGLSAHRRAIEQASVPSSALTLLLFLKAEENEA